MEDLPGADSPPINDVGHEPAGNDDPQDPLRPEIEEEDSARTPPIADPHQDTELAEDDQNPELSIPEAANNDDNDADSDDNLSDVDEAQFQDFDPNAIAIEERPRVVDASGVALLGKHKRKRDDADGEGKKKRREGRREKPKRSKRGEDGADFDDGDDAEGRRRKTKGPGEKRKKRTPSPEDDSNLTPEESEYMLNVIVQVQNLTQATGRKKEFSRKLDEALKKPKTNNRRKAGIDLEQMADTELEEMRRRMAEAAQADTQARDEGKPAMHKLKLLPEVVAMLNRNTLQNALVDPDINLLESVRFFLEPLNDGSLPAYNIQRELFACLAKLPVSKDALVASGIGKVTHFYTRSTKAEPSIRRQAEKLVGEWTRPILKRTDDFRKREFVEATYDPSQLPMRSTQTADKANRAAAARKAALAYPTVTNRARVEGGLGTYTIVPKSDLSRAQPGVRRLGAAGDDLARKLQARSKNQRR
ncbi:transcription factor iws-1 [Aureobasidium subglaciale]|nr:transcription factor iws-1 [Aureobasidium subglaciale]